MILPMQLSANRNTLRLSSFLNRRKLSATPPRTDNNLSRPHFSHSYLEHVHPLDDVEEIAANLKLLSRYDVFPSFRGLDIRQTFLSHLIGEFERKGITTFKDTQIQPGESISPELVRAIRESRICIVILSENYASSSWTLDELVEIMKCRRTSGKRVFTIFYKVVPSHVKKQRGAFGSGYRQTCKGRKEEEKQRWKRALTDVAKIAGVDSHIWHSEADMVTKIAKDVSEALNFTAPRDFDGFVGIEAHIAEMNTRLYLESNEKKMVGIWGPAGIGKTTIARAIYHRISRNFSRSVFMENVKECYRSGDSNDYQLMLRLQEKFLSRILDDKDMKISHLGTAKQRLKSQKVLVVLDDVDKIEQLRALANHLCWFGEGSRIIVTTQDISLLNAHNIRNIYVVEFPSSDDALEIFSQYAFNQKVPPQDYKELATQVVELANRLPLALRVLGNTLIGESVSEEDSLLWESVSEWTAEILARFRNSIDRDIKQVLIVGYNGLSERDKAIFLHIACLFEGITVSCLMHCLRNSGLEIKLGLQVLAGRALISIMKDREIKMHNLLRQMGREIVCRHSIRLPRRCWFFIGARNIYAVVSDITGTGNTVGIIFSGASQVNLASENAPNGMHDQQFSRLRRNLIYMARKLEKLLNGIKGSFSLRITLCFFSMIFLLKYALLCIMTMSPPALANFRFVITRRLFLH